MRKWIFIMSFIFFRIAPITAQEMNDNDHIKLSEQRTSKFIEYSDMYSKDKDSLWFVGKEYKFLNTSSTGSPFFYDAVKSKGSVIFNGHKYSDLELFYDLVIDALVLHHNSQSLGFMFINLNKAWVEEFTLEISGVNYKFLPDYHFRYLENKIPEGYYEVIYQNDLILLVKGSKRINFEAFDSDHFKYNYSQNLYLIKDNKVYNVTRRSDFLSVFEKNKNDIRAYMRHINMLYKNAGRSEIISLMNYCEKLR